MSIFDKIKNPPMKYRPVPFWSWNDKLDPEELRRQIQEMYKAGLGGYFMHARPGIETQYMSEEWMQCIRVSIDEGNKMGMYSWCYDENGWPSGIADGVIPAMGIEYQMKDLSYQTSFTETLKITDRTIGIYKREGNNYKRIDNIAGIEGEEILHIYYNVNPHYIDVLDKKVIAAFIESTYEKYYREFQEHFGKGIQGIFTDEPQYNNLKRKNIPWSFILEDEFNIENGYNLIEVLPSLYFETDNHKKVRYDYWKLVTRLFIEAFSKQIGEWCESHNCKLTGHVMLENSLLTQCVGNGDVMAFYEYMQVPGMDWLGRIILENPIIPRQVSSVAHQLGKKQVLSEMFAGAGWNVSLEELKWIAESQYIHGINFMCQHLEGYSLRGPRKRDCPPSLFYQLPWWDDYKNFNDYFARLSILLTEGKDVAKVLLLHPIRSGWVTYNTRNNEEIIKYDKKFAQLSEDLCNIHVAYDYGCETIMARHGKVEKGHLKVGQCDYKCVIIPPSITLADTTVDLLEQFMEKGGVVIGFEDFPSFINGVEDEKLKLLKRKVKIIPFEKKSIKNELSKVVKPEIAITEDGNDTENIYYRQCDLEGKMLYYIFNLSKDRKVVSKVDIYRKGRVEKINLESGEIQPLKVEKTKEGIRISLTFEPAMSWVIMVTPGEECEEEKKEEHVCLKPVMEKQLGNMWDMDVEDYNSITLDACRIMIGEGNWSEIEPVIFIQNKLMEYGRDIDIELEFRFNADFLSGIGREIYLILEQPDQFCIEVNGQEIGYRDIGWWRDISFKKVNINNEIKKGENKIVLRHKFSNSKSIAIESIYVIGDFEVTSQSPYSEGERRALFNDGPFTLIEKRAKIQTGDLVTQGYPFFAGAIKLSQYIKIEETDQYKNIVFTMPKPDAVLSKLRLNGQEVKAFFWAPYEIDIKQFLKEGDNRVEIELITGCRNLLGPHHHIEGELYRVPPKRFLAKPDTMMDLILGVDNIYTDRYCFVRFGLVANPTIRFYE